MKGRWCSVSGFAVMAVSQKGAVDASRGWTVALPKPRKDAYSAVLFWSQGAFDDRVCPWAVCSQKCLPDERHCHYDISLCAKCNRFWKKIAAAELSLILAVLVGVRHRKSILRFSGGEGTTQKASAGFFIPCSPALSPYLGVRSVCVVENPDMRPVCESSPVCGGCPQACHWFIRLLPPASLFPGPGLPSRLAGRPGLAHPSVRRL